MKKSFAVLIMVVFVCAIVLVGFFGIKVTSYNQITYVKLLDISNKEYDEESKTIILKKGRDYESIPFEYQIDYRALPDDATNKKIQFSVSNDDGIHYKIDQYGLLTIKSLVTFKLFLRTTDGSNVTKEVKIKIL